MNISNETHSNGDLEAHDDDDEEEAAVVKEEEGGKIDASWYLQ